MEISSELFKIITNKFRVTVGLFELLITRLPWMSEVIFSFPWVSVFIRGSRLRYLFRFRFIRVNNFNDEGSRSYGILANILFLLFIRISWVSDGGLPSVKIDMS